MQRPPSAQLWFPGVGCRSDNDWVQCAVAAPAATGAKVPPPPRYRRHRKLRGDHPRAQPWSAPESNSVLLRMFELPSGPPPRIAAPKILWRCGPLGSAASINSSLRDFRPYTTTPARRWSWLTALFAAEPGGSLPLLADTHALLTAPGGWEVSP